jgi:hypothetical protein
MSIYNLRLYFLHNEFLSLDDFLVLSMVSKRMTAIMNFFERDPNVRTIFTIMQKVYQYNTLDIVLKILRKMSCDHDTRYVEFAE